MPNEPLPPGDKRGQRTFRLAMDRSTELSLKNELNILAKKSIAEIGATKEAVLKMPLSEENETALKLKPKFTPQKVKEKQKREPIFHDDLPAKPKNTVNPNHPIYNALDRENTNMKMKTEKPKKYPVMKDVVLTTDQMKKPHVSSVGIVPVRASEAVEGLNVIMKGKPAIPQETEPGTEPVERDDTLDIEESDEPQHPQQVMEKEISMDVAEEECTLPPTPMTAGETKELPRPAIVGIAGTLAPVAMAHRPQPPPKPMTKLRRRFIPSELPGSGLYEKYDAAIDGIDHDSDGGPRSQGSSAYTVKSTKDLLEEAKQIAKGGRKRQASDRERSPTKSVRSDGRSVASSKLSGIGGAPMVPQPSVSGLPVQKQERSVDEIIASLQDGSMADVETDADRRIKEIMNRVVKRTQGVLGDDVLVEEEEEEDSDDSEEKKSSGGARGDDEASKESMVPVEEEKGESEEANDTARDAQSEAPSEVMRDALDKLSELRGGTETSVMETEQSLDTDLMGLDLDFDMNETEHGEEEYDEDGNQMTTPDLQQAWIDLNAPAEVTNEDVINITAEKAGIYPKRAPTFISSWGHADSPEEGEEEEGTGNTEPPAEKKSKNIHHFCTMSEDVQLPDHMRGIWRKYHVPSKFDYLTSEKRRKAEEAASPVKAPSNSPAPAPEDAKELSPQEALEIRQSEAARLILKEAQAVGEESTSEQQLDEWREKAQKVFDLPELEISRAKLQLKSDESFLHWYPAPPKWDVVPTKVKAILFPEYHGAALAHDFDPSHPAGRESEMSEIEEENATIVDPEALFAKQRKSRYWNSAGILQRTCGSARDLTKLGRERIRIQEEQAKEIENELPQEEGNKEEDEEGSSSSSSSVEDEDDSPQGDETARSKPAGTVSEMRAKMAGMRSSHTPTPPPAAVESKPSLFSRPILPPIPPRPGSAPGMIGLEDNEFLVVNQGFSDVMFEITDQKKQLKAFKAGKQTPPGQRQTVKFEDEDEEIPNEEEQEEELQALNMGSFEDLASPSSKSPNSKSPTKSRSPGPMDMSEELTPAEEALQAGRNYVHVQPNRRKRPMKRVDMKRIEDIEKFLSARARPIKRSQSLPRKRGEIERELRVPRQIRERKNSLPGVFDFPKYKERSIFMSSMKNDEREWVRAVWNRWFDQVFPPTPPSSEGESEDDEEDSPLPQAQITEEDEEKAKRKASVASVYSADDVEVYPVTQGEEDEEGVRLMEEEVQRLTDDIETAQPKPRAFDFCRRGAILRKLGKIKGAKEDLDRAISMEPKLLDAYWHRHLVYRLLNQKSAALDDLNYILKFNKTHAGAYRSRAAIHLEKNEITMAIVNFTQAIKHNPDYESYFQRATMYEMRGEMLLAMEDYAQATKLCPTRTEALYKHAMHYFKNENWQSAIDDFTNLLKIEPNNGKARMYRGRAYSMMKQWNPALEDLSAAIHMDPNNAKAYYYRGCLLRKLHPKKALQDLSVSILIDDTDENELAYLHRGILYYAIGKHEDAVPDFESCLKLDHQMACAHVNLGLIFMTKMDNHHSIVWHHQKAIKKFTAAIKSDPTYIKAYVCRAEAYTRIHDIKNALLDITRAIHLKPDVHHYYMYRGKLILQMGNLELAAFCVKHAAELNTGMAHSPTQEAIVQSFLKNYDKAIFALDNAVKSKPVAPLYMLLGKTQMKAQRWRDAVDSFKMALELVTRFKLADIDGEKPWQDRNSWPPEAAEMYYLIGMCQVEERDYFNAHEAFNNAIKVNSKYSEAYYQRGLVRLRLKQSRGIQDFNRALALDPTLFQAFLSRAAYYGMKKQYTKAILNCNEAIHLQPKSIRAYLYRGALKYHIKAFTLAIRDLTQAIAIDSRCTLAYFNRAVCYQDSGNWHKALQDYGIVLLLGDRLSLQVLVNRGLLYYYHQDYPNALHDLLAASQVYPRDKNIHHTLGLCYHKSERLEEAVLSFTRALELDKFFLEALISRGNVFMDYGHVKGRMFARHDYERALHQSPTCLPARVNLAYTLQVAGKYQQAWHQFTAAIQIDPTYKPALEGRAIINLQMSDTFAAFQDINASCRVRPTAELLTNRGVIYQFMNDKVNAMRDYQAALQKDPKYSLAYFNAANMYFHQRQFKQALNYYNSALVYNPDDESALLNRAIAKVLLKDAKGAIADFGKAIKLSPYSAHMYFNRANLYTSLEQYEKAQKDYSKALYIQPDDPHVLKRRADVLGKLGDRQKAVADYRRAIEIQSKKRV